MQVGFILLVIHVGVNRAGLHTSHLVNALRRLYQMTLSYRGDARVVRALPRLLIHSEVGQCLGAPINEVSLHDSWLLEHDKFC